MPASALKSPVLPAFELKVKYGIAVTLLQSKREQCAEADEGLRKMGREHGRPAQVPTHQIQRLKGDAVVLSRPVGVETYTDIQTADPTQVAKCRGVALVLPLMACRSGCW
jgi:hypothetical protein